MEDLFSMKIKTQPYSAERISLKAKETTILVE
jgi:hypothetical protein